MIPANYAGPVRALLAGAVLAGVVVLLTGCDLGVNSHVPDFDLGYTDCLNYTVRIEEYKTLDLVDSSATCPDGSAPFMARADWISTDSTCPLVLSTIVGGFDGIRHVYGCWPKAKPYTGAPF